MGYLTNKPKVIALERSEAHASGFAGVRYDGRAEPQKKPFSVTNQRGGSSVVAGRFATAEEAALRRRIALKALGA